MKTKFVLDIEGEPGHRTELQSKTVRTAISEVGDILGNYREACKPGERLTAEVTEANYGESGGILSTRTVATFSFFAAPAKPAPVNRDELAKAKEILESKTKTLAALEGDERETQASIEHAKKVAADAQAAQVVNDDETEKYLAAIQEADHAQEKAQEKIDTSEDVIAKAKCEVESCEKLVDDLASHQFGRCPLCQQGLSDDARNDLAALLECRVHAADARAAGEAEFILPRFVRNEQEAHDRSLRTQEQLKKYRTPSKTEIAKRRGDAEENLKELVVKLDLLTKKIVAEKREYNLVATFIADHLDGPKEHAIRALKRTIRQCGHFDWDGNNGIPIPNIAAQYAEHFIRALPATAPMPIPTPVPDGSIRLDWGMDSSNAVSVVFNEESWIKCSWNNDVESGMKSSFFNCETPPPSTIEGRIMALVI